MYRKFSGKREAAYLIIYRFLMCLCKKEFLIIIKKYNFHEEIMWMSWSGDDWFSLVKSNLLVAFASSTTINIFLSFNMSLIAFKSTYFNISSLRWKAFNGLNLPYTLLQMHLRHGSQHLLFLARSSFEPPARMHLMKAMLNY